MKYCDGSRFFHSLVNVAPRHLNSFTLERRQKQSGSNSCHKSKCEKNKGSKVLLFYSIIHKNTFKKKRACTLVSFPLHSKSRVPVILHSRLVTAPPSQVVHARVCVHASHKIAQLEGSVAGCSVWRKVKRAMLA